jgi:hypothetical protein
LLRAGPNRWTKSSTTPDFWSAYASLPPEIKRRAQTAFRLWLRHPRHPSLQFKKVGAIWSARIGGGYRALALHEQETFHWFWIGTHDEYERLLQQQ